MTHLHVTIASLGRVPLYRDRAGLLRVVRALARQGNRHLHAFCVVDDHVHVLLDAVIGDARGLRLALRSVCEPELQPTHVESVTTRSHLSRLPGYFLRQPSKHGLRERSALWPGSCLQDLLGARRLLGFSPQGLMRSLPRLRLRDLLEPAGLARRALAPATFEALGHVGPSRLRALAASTLGLSPPLLGRDAETNLARRLCAEVASQLGWSPAIVASLLGTSTRTARRLANRGAPAELHRALRLQHALHCRATDTPAST